MPRSLVERHRSLVRYEVDALAVGGAARNLYRSAIEQFWDDDAYESVKSREEEERATL